MIASVFNSAVRTYLRQRYKRIIYMKESPIAAQKRQLQQLLYQSRNTEMGKKHHFLSIEDRQQYGSEVPLIKYEDIREDIERMISGVSDVLCPGVVKNYSKSSGTTSRRSKYIPMPNACHYGNHVAASWDTMAIVYNENPKAKIFEKKSVIMGGSITTSQTGVSIGDVSALLLQKMHWAGRPFFTPDFETALMNDWEEKIERMASICARHPIEMIGGVPTWTLVLCNLILEKTGKINMLEVWPEAHFYMHGGVGFEPYKEQFAALFPSEDFKYYEVYNASEGYFAVQDQSTQDGMLLLLDNNIYYEFVPIGEVESHAPKALTLEEVEVGSDYALVITTASGLYRYMIGDTVKIVSTNPYRVSVSGRTQQYINVFGEEVMVANTDRAIAATCSLLDCRVSEYSVAPIFMGKDVKGGHQWVIEFWQEPRDMQLFALTLDTELRGLNSDYDAKRYKDIALKELEVYTVPKGTFHQWMKRKGKIGGQNKVPRLSNTDTYIKEILNTVKNV